MRKVDPAMQGKRISEILAAAATCFSQRGFQGTSTNEICAAAGMSPGNLFHYFPNKKALIVAVTERQIAETHALFQAVETIREPRLALDALFDALFSAASDPDDRRLVVEIAAEAARTPDVQLLAHAGDQALRQALERMLTRTGLGEHAALLTPSQAAGFLMLVVDGLFSRAAADPTFDPEAERETLQRVLDGVLPRIAAA